MAGILYFRGAYMKQKVLLLILGIIFCRVQYLGATQHQIDTNELRSLSDYMRYAALNNAGLKAKFEEWKAALEQIPQSGALDDPKFTYSYFIEEVETRVGPQKQKFGIMQVFPWFGKLQARSDAASAQANAAKQRYGAEKLKLSWQVKDAFYEFTYLATATDIAKENLELLQYFEEIARTKYKTASATHPDIIRAQVELAKLEDILKSLHALRTPTVARINSVLNRPHDSQLAWPQKEPLREVQLNQEYIIELLKKANPELAGLKWQVEAAKAKVDLAKKKFYPDIGVGLDWIQTDNAASSTVQDSGKDPVALMFSINIPLWHDSYKAAERQAQANVRKTRQEKINTENEIMAQTIKTIYNVEDSQRKINLYRDILIAKSEELVQASQEAYRSGTIDFLSLIDAQQMLLKYKLSHERAITNNQKKLAELEMLIGKEL